MSTIHDELIAEARTWISGATSLSKSKVIPTPEGSDGVPAPDLPFVLIQYDPLHQEDAVGRHVQWLPDQSGDPVKTIFKSYRASLLVTGYGLDTSEYLLELKMAVDEAPMSVRPISALQNVSALPKGDTEREARYQQDFEVAYRLKLEGPTVPELKKIEITDNFQSEVASDISGTTQIQV